MLNSSSSRIALAAFTRSPFTLTLPPATAAAASERVLKNLAAQSHLSRRIGLSFVSATTIPDFFNISDFTAATLAGRLRQIFLKPLDRIPVADSAKGNAVQPVVELRQINIYQTAVVFHMQSDMKPDVVHRTQHAAVA